MRTSIVSGVVIASLLATVLPGCCSSCKDADDAPAAVDAPDYAGLWTLKSVEGVDAAAVVGSQGRLPDMQIAGDGAVSGFAGVNRMSGRFDATAAARAEPLFGPLVTTKMAGPDHLMALESRLTAALADARTASIEAGELVLLAGDGRELARFTPAPR